MINLQQKSLAELGAFQHQTAMQLSEENRSAEPYENGTLHHRSPNHGIAGGGGESPRNGSLLKKATANGDLSAHLTNPNTITTNNTAATTVVNMNMNTKTPMMTATTTTLIANGNALCLGVNGTHPTGNNNNNCSGQLDSKMAAEVEENNNNNNNNKWSSVRRLLAGVTLTLISAFFFSVTTVIVKFVTDIKPSQMALFRYLGIIILSFPVVLESKEPWFGENNWWWRLWMLLRGVSGCTSLFFRYSAVTYISLADTTIIILSMPVFVFIFARIFLGEQFGRYHILAFLLSLVGIAFASKVDFLFKSGENLASHLGGNESIWNLTSTTTSTTTMGTTLATTMAHESGDGISLHNRLIGTMYACGAMVAGSLVYVMVRKMRKTHQSVILFNFALVAILEMTLINVVFYDFKLPTTGYSAYLVSILAILSFYGQMLLTKAIQIEEAGVVSVVRVSGEAFFAFVFQIIIFKEMPDWYSIVGAVLVLSSVFLLSFRKYVLSLPDDSPTKKRFSFLAI